MLPCIDICKFPIVSSQESRQRITWFSRKKTTFYSLPSHVFHHIWGCICGYGESVHLLSRWCAPTSLISIGFLASLVEDVNIFPKVYSAGTLRDFYHSWFVISWSIFPLCCSNIFWNVRTHSVKEEFKLGCGKLTHNGYNMNHEELCLITVLCIDMEKSYLTRNNIIVET